MLKPNAKDPLIPVRNRLQDCRKSAALEKAEMAFTCHSILLPSPWGNMPSHGFQRFPKKLEPKCSDNITICKNKMHDELMSTSLLGLPHTINRTLATKQNVKIAKRIAMATH